MDTRGKSNAEFRTEVNDALARHESSFDQVNAALQAVLTELQAIRTQKHPNTNPPEINPFASESSSQLHSSRNPNTTSQTHSHLKLSFPRFDGSEPTGWVYKAEQYFEFQAIDSAQQVQLASFHLDGIALQWHRWLTKFRGPLLWNEFVQALLQRFGPTDYEDPSESLTRLRQTTSVAAYQEAFERLSHQVDGLPEGFLIGCFVAGLRDEIHIDVKIKHPHTLTEAIGVARLIEERNLLQRKTHLPIRSSSMNLPSRAPANSAAGVLGPPPSQRPNLSPTSFRRITTQEARERREKGLCFYCDEKFKPGHRCERPQLFMIEDSSNTSLEEEITDTEDIINSEDMPKISFHAIAGAEHPQTLRVLGQLGNKKVTVLIDGGSTHNFIDQVVVTKFGIPINRSQRFQVMVANREKITCTGQCQSLTLIIQGIAITANYYVLPVTACQVVLGVQWLETLGPIEMDFKKLTMSYKTHGEKHTFYGLKHTGHAAFTEKEFHGLQGNGFFLQIIPSHSIIDSSSHPPELKALLSEFSQVFEEPTGLPPQRAKDHHIPLQPNSSPVSVRPYRYPYYQKTEIEKMVQDLLKYELIRPSNSPFSSPVLLVKKANGAWRFCVDYRALNEITIKDKYPIPVIDELLDELHGSRYYSKLDLRSGYHQIRVRDDDIPKTAFRTHEGHYEFVVMPFGLTNAPATFQSLMNDLFRPHLRKFILVFFDDILVYSKSWEDHLTHLHTILKILADNTLFAKESKCRFGVTQVDYMGHVISNQGVSVDPTKIQAVVEWPTPTTAKGVRGFLGLAGYYRKFIRHFGGIAAPLTRLLTKDGFQWSAETDLAFQRLKEA
ncbi:uncharacterized protein LOC133691764 [Populus nigra]|uniref:uncharacterized protein LOC133691764 n=1 Tax=Populus nigra TaxID=3691 RepID=UPI002B26982A|nr:uncharacterized protein LOC133691764 [Populus nigra]